VNRSILRIRGGRRWLVSSAATLLIAVAALAPTSAEAAPNTLVATASDATVKGSCDFRVVRIDSHGGNPVMTARLTMRANEIKSSFFAPRRVANIGVGCVVAPRVGPVPMPGLAQEFLRVNNGSSVYRSQYIKFNHLDEYIVCVQAFYVLLNGTGGRTPQVCNPVV
jgi:hypothetical protein